ncbi:MAG: hypothetical protein FWC40_04965 [Proteobacteria bacterium]|nr:hypothetical protein [Pseudomonadota bacterium]
MRDFLVAEWKTLLFTIVFCSAIFGWFYFDEARHVLSTKAETAHHYTCLKPGEALAGFELGLTQQAFENGAQAKNFSRLPDESPLGMASFGNAEGSLRLNFFQDRLQTIEYYPATMAPDDACRRDFAEWARHSPQNSAPIFAEGNIYARHPGVIVVRHEAPDAPLSNTNAATTSLRGWIVTPIL